MSQPRLSACLIVGDAHVGVLARCLKSILHHPSGPTADEIVIGWNGKDDHAFLGALGEIGVAIQLPPRMSVDGERTEVRELTLRAVRLVIHSFTWPNDFAKARNINWGYATGSWIYYQDTDDLWALPDSVALRDSLALDPPSKALDSEALTFPDTCSLPEFVAALPAHINLVLAPYNYLNDPNTDRPLIRKRRPRIVRQDGLWVWVSEVHEILRHAFGREIPVWCPSVLLVHAPVQSFLERAERNKPILARQVQDILARKETVPAPLLYAEAGYAMEQHDFVRAGELFHKAALQGDAQERFYYTLMAARCAIESEDWIGAGECAKNAVAFCPERPEGYFAMSEVAFRSVQDDERTVAWYEAGKDKKVTGPVLVDDRFERCLRPVRFAGVSYLRYRRFADALEVAERALAESEDAFAIKIRDAAQQGVKRQKIRDGAVALAQDLRGAGYPARALALLSQIETVLGDVAVDDFAKLRFEIETAIPALPEQPTGKRLGAWLALRGELDVALPLPVDAADDPKEILAQAAGRTPEGASLLAFTTDPLASNDYINALRLDAFPAGQLLETLERHGDVEDLSLLEEELDQDSPTPVRHTVARMVKRSGVSPFSPDVTFFCPVFAETWGPWRILTDGTGGSEESVIYAARELSDRGLNVEVYAPLDDGRHRGVHVEGRVRWRPLGAFDPTKRLKSIAVIQRAPWAIRIPAFDSARTYLWHQDAEYQLGWTPVTAKVLKHFWVSRWQRDKLLRQVGLTPGTLKGSKQAVDWSGAVIGNGIPESALAVPFPEKREAMTIAYTSSPVRGLAEFLAIWPEVHAAFPDARLRVYYGWATSPRGLAQYRAYVMRLATSMKNIGVEWIGRMPQFELEQELVSIGIWGYNAHAFNEGFCVAGVRAAAAGCVPVYMRTGALPETLYPSPFSTPGIPWVEGGKQVFLEALLNALQAEKSEKSDSTLIDRQGYRNWASQFTWRRVVTGMLAEWHRRDLLSGRQEISQSDGGLEGVDGVSAEASERH